MSRKQMSITLPRHTVKAVKERGDKMDWAYSHVIEFCIHEQLDELDGFRVPQRPNLGDDGEDDDSEGNGWLDVIKGAA